MIDLLHIEIIVWLVLFFFLITTPLLWFFSKYVPQIRKFIQTIKELEFNTPEIIKKNISSNPGNDSDTKEIDQEDIKQKQKISQDSVLNLDQESNDKKNLEEIINDDKIQQNIDPKKEDNQAPKQKDVLKRNKQLETIKFAALSNRERGKLDQYEKKLIEGLALDPDNTEFLKLLGEHYFEAGQHIKALSILKKVVNNETENHKAIRQIGQIYIQQDKIDTAQIIIEKAITLKDDHPKYLISLVEIHYSKKDITSAIQTMEKIIKLRPKSTNYLATIASLYDEAKKPSLAEKYYKKILEIDPSNADAKKALKNY